MKNLFPKAVKTFAQQAALKEFGGTATSSLVRELRALGKGTATESSIRRAKQAFQRLKSTGVLDVLTSTQASGFVREVEQYARGGGGLNLWLEVLLDNLGPVGDIVRTMIRPTGAKRAGGVANELNAAAALLNAFGIQTGLPKRDFRPAAQRKADDIDDARKLLEAAGWTVTPPPEARQAARERQRTANDPVRRVRGEMVELRVGGRRRIVSENDPLVTGEMIDVDSSNVHSIGFEYNWADPMKGTLKVRFLQKSKRSGRMGPGPLYYYFGVHPDVFAAFRRAASMGGFVWDRLRIRGTVSGHRYQYQLRGIVGGYVPRKATRYGQNEYFIRRQFRGVDRSGNRRVFESRLQDARVTPLRSNVIRPNQR